MGKRVRLGDVIEIPTSKGLAYAQYSHKKDQWGALLRVLPGFFLKRPDDFGRVVAQKERFVTFFPLQAAVNRGIFKVVANEDVPVTAMGFPVFRAAGLRDRSGRPHHWNLWDGEREWRVAQLSEDQWKLPIRSVWNDTLLIERIEEEWTPEKER
jgi:hypothetical protein